MADQKAINDLYKRLNEEINNDNDDQVLRLAESLISKGCEDSDVVICRTIAQLKLSKFDVAGQFFEKEPKFESNNNQVNFGRAYQLYKTAKYDKCLQFIKQLDTSDFKIPFALLEAQIQYKRNNFLDAAKMYLAVLEEQSIEDTSEELITNLLNCLSQIPIEDSNLVKKSLELTHQYIDKFSNDDIIRELFYNLALLYTNIGDLTQAKNYLKRFKKEMEAEGESDDAHYKEDILRHDIQNDFIDNSILNFSPEQQQEKLKEYSQKLDWKVNDYYKTLMKNNIVFFKDKSKELTESIRKLDEIIKFASNSDEFTRNQVLYFKVNKLILYLSKNKYNESQKLINEIDSTYSPEECISNDKFMSCQFYLLFRMKKYKEIDQLKQSLLEKVESLSPNTKLPVLLLTGEINRLFGNQKQFVTILKEIMNLDKRILKNNAISSLILSTLNQNTAIVKEFGDLVSLIENHNENPDVLSQVAEIYVREKQFDHAIKIYEKILNQNQMNIKALERLSYLYSFTDINKAQSYLERIPPVDAITDANELRRLELDYLPSKSTNIKYEEAKTTEHEVVQKKIKKRKRKPRYPKNFDPENPGPGPDPERWLPKLERQKYRKLAKKKGLLTRTQGGTAGKESVQTFQKGPSTANTEATQSANSKKKKKKR